jgi:phospholipid/cholesterol/gamma-HCH transport system substrate-binding protein
VLNSVDSGEGTIGQLMKNKDIYNHTDEMLKNTNDLILAVRKDPKKYLTIHLKIF